MAASGSQVERECRALLEQVNNLGRRRIRLAALPGLSGPATIHGRRWRRGYVIIAIADGR